MEQGKGAQRFFISETNPNDSVGGCGCLCSESHNVDRGGPYAIFNHTATDSNLSPHIVVCQPCVAAVTVAMGEEYIKAGEPVDSTAEVIPHTPEREANPVAEDGWELPSI